MSELKRQTFKSIGFQVLLLLYWLIIQLSLLSYGANDPSTVAFGTIGIFVLLPILLCVKKPRNNTQGPVTICLILLIVTMGWMELTASFPELGTQRANLETIYLHNFQLAPHSELFHSNDVSAFLKVAFPLGVFILSTLFFDNDQSAVRALRAHAILGGLSAIFAIAQFVWTPDIVIVTKKIAYTDSLTGFFVNRNTAATFFGISAIVLLFLSWGIRAFSERGAFQHAEPSLRAPHAERKFWHVIYVALLIASFTALMLTKSRAGVASAAVGLLYLTVVLVYRRVHDRHITKPTHFWQSRFLKIALGVVTVLLVFPYIGERLILRSATIAVEADTRFCITPALIQAAVDHLPLGVGLGGFETAFMQYRDPNCGVLGIIDKAHNFYLEGLITMGLVFPVMWLGVVVYLCTAFWRCIVKRRRFRHVGTLGFALLITVILHSAFDFSLQVPGFSIFFAAILAPILTICTNNERCGVEAA